MHKLVTTNGFALNHDKSLQIYLVWVKRQAKHDSHFLICSVFFVSKGNLFYVYFTTLQLVLVPCGDGRTSPRTLP